MVLDDSIRVLWKKCVFQMIQLDAFIIYSAFQFLDKPIPSPIGPPKRDLQYNSLDYQYDLSDLFNKNDSSFNFFKSLKDEKNSDYDAIKEDADTSLESSKAVIIERPHTAIGHFMNYRTAICLQEIIAAALLDPVTYKTEKDNLKNDLVSYIYKNEKSLEIIEVFDEVFSIIGTYGSTDQRNEDEQTITTLIEHDWNPKNTQRPHMDGNLDKCIQNLKRILVNFDIYFDKAFASLLIRSWYDIFYSRISGTHVIDFLENEIPKFSQYFESARPTPGTAEFHNPAVIFIKDFVDISKLRGNLETIKSRDILSILKAFRRLNFITEIERGNKILYMPTEYHLISLLVGGDSKLGDLFVDMPDTLAPIGRTPRPKPPIGNINPYNLFPGDFTSRLTSSSLSSAYRLHLNFLDHLNNSLKNPFAIKDIVYAIKERG